MAARTFGTDDVRHWTEFSSAVMRHGPVGIYGVSGTEALYNHPPLIGWLLLAAGQIAHTGIPLSFLFRLPASVADLGSTLLIWSLVRRHQGEKPATLAALAFTLSPLGFVISGFHGNTDPVFVALLLLATWLLLTDRSPLGAGIALGLAVSVKVVAAVAVPVLLVVSLRRGRSVLWRLIAGGLAVFALVWLPALALQPAAVLEHVLGYAGTGPRQWGLSQFAHWAGVPRSTAQSGGDSLRLGIACTAGLVPAWLAHSKAREDQEVLACIGLPLVLMLLLSPCFGMQYLAWPLASAYLVAPFVTATTYNVTASVYAVLVYSAWSEAPPWRWDKTYSGPVHESLLVFMTFTFAALLVVAARGSERLFRSEGMPGSHRLPPRGGRPRAARKDEEGSLNARVS